MRTATALVLVLAGLALVGCGEGLQRPVSPPSPVTTTSPSPTFFATTDILTPSPTVSTARIGDEVLVTRVIDGDTVEIEGGARVRYIGMDTPEDTSVKECFGDEATRRNRELVEGRLVELERDISDTDRFDRLLRYVWVDGEMVNEVLIAEGLASVSTFPPDVRYVERFLGLEGEARSLGLGLWSACTEGQGILPIVPGGNGCDPSYPSVCIPPFPPALDCGEIAARRFAVLAPDPHGFDGDNDGIGCEN